MMTTRPGLKVACLTLVLGACGDLPGGIERARALWAETKANCGTYNYTLFVSDSTGGITKTSFEITNDVPTARSFLRMHTDSASQVFVIDEAWAETAAELGTHRDRPLPRTMEQLYDDCDRDVLSRDRATNGVTFSSDEHGVLVSCFYVPQDCFDDCTRGDMVQGFACGPLDLTVPRP
jgi:hypothetical protein